MARMEYEGNKNVVGMQLKLMRTKKKITQKELAARMQVMGFLMDQRAISQIENNGRVVTDFELAGFCEVLHCTERDLLQDFREKLKD